MNNTDSISDNEQKDAFFLKEIYKTRKKGRHPWKPVEANMNIGNWQNDSWEAAKCFLPDKTFNRLSDIRTVTLYGFLHIIIKWKRFHRPKVLEKMPFIEKVKTLYLLREVFSLHYFDYVCSFFTFK